MIVLAQPPLPDPMPAIVRAACPWQGQLNLGCFYARGVDGVSGPVVYVAEGGGLWMKEHELGHAYAAQRVSPAERVSIGRAAGWGGWRAEVFADDWALCRLRVRPVRDPWVPSPYGVRSVRGVARLCAAIARAF